MIKIHELTVAFGGVTAIDGLNAVLSEPVCGLIGPNGAGKTTLVNVLGGLVRPNAGQVELDGVALLPMTPLDRVRFGVRRSFQTEQVVEDLTVWDNVQAVLDHVPHERAAAGQQIARALAHVGLLDVATQFGRELNLYQRRMVEIAKSLVGGPKLLLLDEPGAGLTEQEARELRRAIRAVPDFCGAQVLLIDHDVNLIAATCSQTLVLDFGRRIALGPTREVLDDPVVRAAYLGTS